MIIPAKEQTSAAVAQHYDDLDPFHRELWGITSTTAFGPQAWRTRAQAVENLIACVAQRLELKPGQRVCDVAHQTSSMRYGLLVARSSTRSDRRPASGRVPLERSTDDQDR